MPSEAGQFEPDRRLHRLSWLFVAATHLKQLLLPLLAVLVLGVRDQSPLWALLIFPLLLVGAFWHQWVYRYGFGPTGLVIRQGLFFRNLRRIDYRRIENIDTERNLLHRLMGVAEVKVETSSGGKPEAVIRVLDQAAVREMRERIFGPGRPQAAPAESAQEAPLLRLSIEELVRFGLVDNRGMVVVAALFGLLAQAGLLHELGQWLGSVVDHGEADRLIRLGLWVDIGLGLISLLGLIVGTRLLSILLALVTLWDFTLTREANELQARYGLFTRLGVTLRLPRIQAVYESRTLLHRLLRRASLRVDLAGSGGGGHHQRHQGGGTRRERWLAPICTPARARELLRIALPRLDFDTPLEWRPLSPRARRRLFRRASYVWLLLATAPTVIWTGWHACWILPLPLPVFWLHAKLYVHYTRWALSGDAIWFRHGWLNRRFAVAPRDRVQSVRVTRNPFDRWHGMASVEVDTAGANAWGMHIRIPLLDRSAAEALADALYRGDRTL